MYQQRLAIRTYYRATSQVTQTISSVSTKTYRLIKDTGDPPASVTTREIRIHPVLRDTRVGIAPGDDMHFIRGKYLARSLSELRILSDFRLKIV